MTKTSYLFVALLLSCMLNSFALAESLFYIGGGIGQSYVEEDDVLAGEDFEDEDFAFKVFGGYRFLRNFAVELDYNDFGETDDNILGIDTEVDLYAIALYGVGILPLSEQFELFAKLGVAYWDAEADAEFAGVSASDNENDTNLAYGLGAAFAFTEQFAVRVEYEGIDVDDDFDRLDLLTIGGEVRF